MSRPSAGPEWTGDIGRVEAFFEPDRLPDLEHRLGLAAGGFTPQHRGDLHLRADRNDRRDAHPAGRPRVRPPRSSRSAKRSVSRRTLSDSMFYELYDPTPVIDIDDPAVIEPLRARMLTALA